VGPRLPSRKPRGAWPRRTVEGRRAGKGHGVTKNTRGTQTRNIHRRPGWVKRRLLTTHHDGTINHPVARGLHGSVGSASLVTSQRQDRPGNSLRRLVNNARHPYTLKTSNCKRDESRNVYSAINLPADANTARDVLFFFLFFLVWPSASSRRPSHGS